MKCLKLRVLASLCLTLPAPAQSPGYAAWTGLAALEVTAPGLTRLELPADVLHASAAAVPLADIRILSPSGIETPYAIEWPRIVQAEHLPAAGFRASLHGETTVIEFETGSSGAVNEIELQTGAVEFVKAATLEGSADGTRWSPLVEGDILDRKSVV